MSDEMDPEVIADLQLRAASEHDSTRTRGAGVYDWRPGVDVATWPCRRAVCRQPVGVTQEAIDSLYTSNEILRRLGQREVPTDAVVICRQCRDLFASAVCDRNKQKRDEIADLVRRMKDSTRPRQEHEVIKRLTALHHPDVPGLIESLAAKLEGGGNKKAKAKGSKL